MAEGARGGAHTILGMSVQQIRLFGDPILRTRASEVLDFDKELRTLVADLTDTMLDAPGAGLAAPQIGVGLRVFTWYVDGELVGAIGASGGGAHALGAAGIAPDGAGIVVADDASHVADGVMSALRTHRVWDRFPTSVA